MLNPHLLDQARVIGGDFLNFGQGGSQPGYAASFQILNFQRRDPLRRLVEGA